MFDLGVASLLALIANDSDRLPVTMHNLDLMCSTHGLCRHQYAIAQIIIDADVVIKLTTVKTDKCTA